MNTNETNLLKTDTLGRVTVPAENREEILDAFEASSMSGAAFAKAHGIKVSTFATWIQKRRRSRGDYNDQEIRRKLRMKSEQPKASSSIQLLEVTLDNPEPQPKTPLELELPNGAKIKLSSESQLPLLNSLLANLPC